MSHWIKILTWPTRRRRSKYHHHIKISIAPRIWLLIKFKLYLRRCSHIFNRKEEIPPKLSCLMTTSHPSVPCIAWRITTRRIIAKAIAIRLSTPTSPTVSPIWIRHGSHRAISTNQVQRPPEVSRLTHRSSTSATARCSRRRGSRKKGCS